MEFKKEQKIINKLLTLRKVGPSQDFINLVKTNLVYSLSPPQAQKTPMFAFRAAVLGLIFVVLVSGGIAYASQSSLPGEFLYPVKKTFEAVRIRLVFGPNDKANLHLQLIDERLNELQELSQNQSQDLDTASSEYEKAVGNALENAKKTGDGKELLNQLKEKFSQHTQILKEVAQQAPSQTKGALDKATQASQNGAAKAKEALKKELFMGTIAEGTFSGHHKRKNYVITNVSDWNNLWSKVYSTVSPEPPPPKINFTENNLLAVFQGSRNSGGYNIEIIKVVERADSLEISIKESSPGSNCFNIQALTQPYHIIKIEKIDKKVIFNITKGTINCG